jgi:hypothetical protein
MVEHLRGPGDAANSANKEEKFAQFKENRLNSLRTGEENLDEKILDIVMHGKEPLLVGPEDLAVDKEHISEYKRNLARIYEPSLNVALENPFLSEELARARINTDWAEQEMLKFRESESGDLSSQLYDEATIAEMYGTMAVAKNFLKNTVLRGGAGWRGQEAYKQRIEIWADTLVNYQYWVRMAEQCIERNKYWASEEGQKRAAELSTTEKPRTPEIVRRRSDDSPPGHDDLFDGMLGIGPFRDLFNN